MGGVDFSLVPKMHQNGEDIETFYKYMKELHDEA